METHKMTEAESLELITSMIRSSRRELAKNSYRPFLIWGYTTLVVTLIELALHLMATPSTSPAIRLWIWWMIPLIGGGLMLYYRDHSTQTRSQLDINIGAVWGTLSFTMVPVLAMILIIAGSAGYLVLPMVLVLMGAATMITGTLTRLTVLSWGGAASIIGALLISLLALWFKQQATECIDMAVRAVMIERFLMGQMVIFALSFLCTMIIPGHYMKRMFNNPQEQ